MSEYGRNFGSELDKLLIEEGDKKKHTPELERQRLLEEAESPINQLQDELGLITIFGGANNLETQAYNIGAEIKQERENKIETLIDQTNEIFHAHKWEKSAHDAIKLRLFNFIVRNQPLSSESLQKELDKLRKISNSERDLGKANNPLPTIGIEIEIPRKAVSDEKEQILDDLDIKNELEYNNDLEINPLFSYDAATQARLIQELAELGIFPLNDVENNGTTSKKIADWASLSLHINLGMPPGMEEEDFGEHYLDEAYKLSDTVVYAYSSARRLETRKTSDSVFAKDDVSPSRKNQRRNSKDNFSLIRLELRAVEFKDYPSYRMLLETQKLGAMLASHIKTSQHKNRGSKKEKALAILWSEFSDEMAQYFRERKITPAMFDTSAGKDKAIELLENSDIKEDCRKIIHRYAKEVTQIIETKEKAQAA